MRQCYNCGWEWRKPHRPAFREMCPRCDAFLHSCKNCVLYDLTAHQQCKSSTIELNADKERGNFCDEFRFTRAETAPSAGSSESAKPKKPETSIDPREKWRQLFKDE